MTTLDRDIETLTIAKTAWARLPLERKIAMLEGLKPRIRAVAEEWVRAAVDAKGLRPGSPLAGEEWTSGPWAVLYAANRYLRTLRAIAGHGEPRLPPFRRRSDGRTVMRVFPHDLYDRVLLNGIAAEVWFQPGVTPAQARAEAASFYRVPNPEGRVSLVLGAGNIASIAPLDVLYKLYAEGSVCVLKMNPVNAYLGPLLERAFEPFVEAGYLRFAYGGADAGAYLCAHPEVDEIHITGSAQTHDAIAAAVNKRITSELGNVSPTIVVPGAWSDADVEFQAQNIATQKAHNAGFNCIASQVLILPREWDRSTQLVERVERIFAGMEQRPEYYPGAPQRRENLAPGSSALRSVLRIDDPDRDRAAFVSEAFCGVLICVEFSGDAETFLRNAVTFANERLHGTLGANLIAHPDTLRAHAAAIDRAIDALRYGCVGVNAWTGLGYFLAETPWGAYPGHTLADIQSGIGVVHNSYFLERTEKSVIRAPFAPFPRSLSTRERTLLPLPPWFVTNRRQAEIGRALCDFEVHRTPALAARVASIAMRA